MVAWPSSPQTHDVQVCLWDGLSAWPGTTKDLTSAKPELRASHPISGMAAVAAGGGEGLVRCEAEVWRFDCRVGMPRSRQLRLFLRSPRPEASKSGAAATSGPHGLLCA
jgi:hypothetical protein